MNGDPVDVAIEVIDEAEVVDLAIHDPNDVTRINGVRVVDVGQGDCIGLLDQNDDVFCYVDYGGYNYHPEAGNSSTDPSAHRMPATLNGKHVTVILTHWDKDHCWSADKKNSDAQNCAWIAPRQYVSPSVAKLATKLSNAKRWPESIGNSAVPLIVGTSQTVTIRKCEEFDPDDDNADRNLTGLAITIISEKADGTDEQMLLPGDCSFDRIPNWDPAKPIKGLVAYHHGSHTHWTVGATDVAIQQWRADSELTYSVGFNSAGTNSYGHPDKAIYGPDWNTNSSTTADARANSELGVDMKWS